MSEARDVRSADWEERVLGAEKPVLVDLWAEWCGPCRVVGPIVDEISAERADDLEVFKLDVDANPEIAVRYGVNSIPTLLVFRDGEEAGRIVGALPKRRIEAQLDEVLGARA